MHEIEAMLHAVAIVTMLLTRLMRSATSDTQGRYRLSGLVPDS